MRNTYHKGRRNHGVDMGLIRQKLIGFLLIAISVLLLCLISRGATVEERDGTALLFLVPMGLYLIFGRGFNTDN